MRLETPTREWRTTVGNLGLLSEKMMARVSGIDDDEADVEREFWSSEISGVDEALEYGEFESPPSLFGELAVEVP